MSHNSSCDKLEMLSLSHMPQREESKESGLGFGLNTPDQILLQF